MKLFNKSLALILTIVMLISAIPLSCFSAEKKAAEPTTANMQTDEKELKVIGEVEEKRNEFTKVYTLEDGSFYEVKSSSPLHVKKDNKWVDATKVESPESVKDIDSTINELIDFSVKESTPTRSGDDNTIINYNDFDFRFLGENSPNQNYFTSEGLLLVKDLSTISINPAQLTYSYMVKMLFDLDDTNVGNDTPLYPNVTGFACQSDWTGYYEDPIPVDDFDDFDYTSDDSVDIIGTQKVTAQSPYTYDATNLYNRWEGGVQENYGICFMTDYYTNFGVGFDGVTITRRYKNISALNTETSYHSVDMGLAGTALIEDYSGDVSIFRNEMGMSNTTLPVEIKRLVSSQVTGDNFFYGENTLINYHSIITHSGQTYTWGSLKGENVTFTVTNTSQDTSDQEGLGYSLNVNSKTITDSHNTVYTFTLYNGNYYLSTVVDAYGNAVNIAYSTQSGKRRINYIEEPAIHRRYAFGYTNVNFSYNGNSFSRSMLTSITARYKSGGSYTDIKIGNVSAKIQYQYVAMSANKVALWKATYPDSSVITYNYDADGNITNAIDVDGRVVSFDYSGSVPIYSYGQLGNTSEYEITKTTADRNYQTLVAYDEKVPNIDDNSSDYFDKSSLEISNSYAFGRTFTDQNNKKVRTVFDEEFRPSYVLDSKGDAYLFTYGDNDSITKIKKHNSANNLIYNGNFEEELDGWDTEGVDEGIVEDKIITDATGKRSTYMLLYTDTTDDIEAYQIADVSEISSGTKLVLDADAILNSGASIGNHFSGVEVYACDFSGEVASNAQPLLSLGFGDCYKYEKQHKCGYFTLPNDVEYLKVRIHYTPQFREGYFDNISLIADVNGKIVETMSELPSDSTVRPTETYTRNAHGLPTEHVLTYGSDMMVEKFTYNSNAPYSITSHTDFNNVPTTYSYNDTTGLLNSKVHTAATTSYTYNPMGLLASVSTVYNNVNNDPVTMTNSFTYSHNKITSVTHGSVVYSYDYDSFGRVKGVSKSTDSGQHSTDLISTSYANGKVDTITYANGDQIKYTYDADTKKVTAIAFKDATDNDFTDLATYQYDLGAGESIRISDVHSDRQISVFEDGTYSVIDNNTDSVFPELPILNAVENPDGSETVNVFDLKYTYDHDESEPDSNTGISHTESTLRYAVDEVPVSFTITENNQPVSVAYGGTQSDDYTTFITEKDTDVFGRVVSTSAHYETADEHEREISNSYGYKTFDPLIDGLDDQDATSNLISSYRTTAESETDMDYDCSFIYTYNNDSNLVKSIHIVNHENNSNNSSLYAFFEYDALGQMTLEYFGPEDKLTFYQYDSNGNVTQKKWVEQSATISESNGNCSYQLNSTYYYEKIVFTYSSTNPNQLESFQEFTGNHTANGDTETGATAVSVTYDDNGNALSTATDSGPNKRYTLAWDGTSLVSAENASKKIEYVYDTDNHLVRRKVYKKTNNTTSLDSVEEFVWRNGRVDAMEYYTAEDEALRISAKYLYDEEGKLVGLIPHVKYYFAEMQNAPQIDLSEVPMESDVPIWLINDAQGNIVAMYSEDKGISFNCKFDADGNISIDLKGSYVDQLLGNQTDDWQTVPALVSIAMFYSGMNNFTYRGYYQDRDTGLIFTNGRVYNPYLSRFINSEPKGIVDNIDNCLSFNEYAFAMNNPVNNDALNQSIFDKNSVPYKQFKSVLWMKPYFG